jgi:hypothetical protein
MMTVAEHLLFVLAEECAEIAKEACKAGRFGLDDCDPTIRDAVAQRILIRKELTDLLAVVEMMVKDGIIGDPTQDRAAIYAKKMKVVKFMAYAQEAGALGDG